MANEAPYWAPAAIFALLFALNLLLKLYPRFFPSDVKPQERALLKEIQELHRSANELSSPATFSKAAKVRRSAVAKEKELALLKEKPLANKHGRVLLYAAFPRALKAAVYLLLVQQFWHVSVANIPVSLLRPTEFLLYIGKKDVSGELVAIGIVPWIILSSRVSEYLSTKVAGSLSRKSDTRKT